MMVTGVVRLGEDLEHRAGEASLALDGLVRIGVGAEVDRRALVAGAGELAAQHRGGLGLGAQLGLEVEARRQPEVRVGRAREAVHAAVLAAAVRIDRAIERYVGRVVARDDRLDLLVDDGGRGPRRVVVGIVGRPPAVIEGHPIERLVAPRGVAHRAAPGVDHRQRRVVATTIGRLAPGHGEP
jgi:hypothetical protein